ncbi:MAG: dTMP kinase [Chlorobi bacterium]|nr:dTMP kinase [Chlorobiota bacterium]
MSFIVIEGLDGSGKSTQIRLLREYFDRRRIAHYFIHFPRTDTGLFGELIARFLRGEMGHNREVDPYLVALLYAGDRKEAAVQIRREMDAGKLVLIDRYTYSNIAFQCAKFIRHEDQEKLQQWILDLEFNHYGIPKPDLNLFLDVPFSFTQDNLSRERNGIERGYLKGSQDIHEQDLTFQQRVAEIYRRLITSGEMIAVNCAGEKDIILPTEEVFSRILEKLNTANIF